MVLAGDSVYREHYERMKRELDFTKKKLAQQHEEELEQAASQKQKVERKVRIGALVLILTCPITD